MISQTNLKSTLDKLDEMSQQDLELLEHMSQERIELEQVILKGIQDKIQSHHVNTQEGEDIIIYLGKHKG